MLTTQFKILRMEESKSIYDFHAKLIDITNKSALLGEEYSEAKILGKMLRSFLMRFQAKVTEIEESKDVDNLRINELLGSLQTFEMGLKIHKKESDNTFNTTNMAAISSDDEIDDDEETTLAVKKFP